MQVTETTTVVLDDIRQERHHQYRKFGHKNVLSTGTDLASLACLGEEFGEACHEVCEFQLDELPIPAYELQLYNELLQVAAVACAFAEKIRIRNHLDGAEVYHNR